VDWQRAVEVSKNFFDIQKQPHRRSNSQTEAQPRRTVMSKFVGFVIAVLSLATIAPAQSLKSVAPHYKPGDNIRFRVEFDGADPNFEEVSLSFVLEGNVPEDQPGFSSSFGANRTAKVNPGVFEVDGTVPQNIARGTYRLKEVNAAVGNASKAYEALHFDIRVQIDNDARFIFPALKSVTPQTPQ
jgi:hypothetical protein